MAESDLIGCQGSERRPVMVWFVPWLNSNLTSIWFLAGFQLFSVGAWLWSFTVAVGFCPKVHFLPRILGPLTGSYLEVGAGHGQVYAQIFRLFILTDNHLEPSLEEKRNSCRSPGF